MPKIDAKVTPGRGVAPRPSPKPRVAKIVNRGPAGLLNSLADDVPDDRPTAPTGTVNNISDGLRSLIVPIAGLTPDPNNARTHPERNMQAIMLSLSTHGQLKPIVVKRDGMVVMAGNGTMEAARRLGWTKIAANVTDLTEVEAAAYGLADNRTAELATWDVEVLARLAKLVDEAAIPMIGWSTAEMEVLRNGDVVLPPTYFPEVDESIETEHQCPKCGYSFSGGKMVAKESGDDDPQEQEDE